MGKSWTSKREFALLSGELAVSEDRDFERRALPLIRAIWPEAVTPPSRRSFDQCGVDHLVWADIQPFPLVIQYKGFRSSEHEIGDSQTKQCLASIDSFKKSGLTAETYVLLHNRDGRNKTFRDSVQNALKRLVSSGQVEKAFLWDRRTFLNEAFESTLQRTLSHLGKAKNEMSILGETRVYNPLEIVPLATRELVINQYRLEDQSHSVSRLADPSEEILNTKSGKIVLVIAEAGYGKTTAAFRTFFSSDHRIFYVPSAGISKTVISAKDLLFECVNVDELFSYAEESDQPTLRRLVRPVIEFIFKDSKQHIVLIIDGLDESIYFSRAGGLQSLFNQLRDVRVPIVLLARSEFWHSRIEDFTASFGDLSKHGDKKRKRIKLIELTPWSSHKILLLADRFRCGLSSFAEQERIDRFIEIVRSGEYKRFYGDIPRRPLFLRFILETVAEQGVHYTGRAKLYYDWVRMKISRDISRPRQFGGDGRLNVVSESESADVTLRLSLRAMMYSAAAMTTIENGVLDLLPECKIDDVLTRDRTLKDLHDPTGLFLNSLLLPVPSRLPHQSLSIRFAHRMYQEFFLALYYSEHQAECRNVQLPPSVFEMLDDLQREGLVD